MRISDWSSDVCSSDLAQHGPGDKSEQQHGQARASQHRAAIALGPERCVEEDRLEDLAIHDDEGQAEQEPGRLPRQCARHLLPDVALPLVRLRLRSEEHTSELQSLMRISYAVFCLKKKNNTTHYVSTLEQDRQIVQIYTTYNTKHHTHPDRS